MDIGGFLLIAILVGVVGIPILAVYSLREWAAIGSATFPEWQARVGTLSVAAIGLILLSIVATLLCSTLKDSARVLALVAGVLRHCSVAAACAMQFLL
jgi:hypothetical protein